MLIKGIKNANIYVYNEGIKKTSLKVNNDKIEAIGDIDTEGFITIPDDLIVVPGFVDKHIHGARKSDFMNPTYADLKNITTAIVAEGTTACLATTMTQDTQSIYKALGNIGHYIKDNVQEGAEILGIHLEGPFISPKFAGAQPKEYIIPCDVTKFKLMNDIALKTIKQVSLAPEEDGEYFVSYLKNNHIVASLGHTNASYDIAKSAIERGAKSATHTYNAMKGVHHRDIGVVGATMEDNRVNAEVICDLIHVSPAAVRLLYKMKGIYNISLITDSMEAKYMPDGEYELGGQKVYVKNNEARLADGTLAGSILKMNDAVRNFQKVTGVKLTDAIDAASINPARVIGVDNRKGSIEVGKDADFTVIDRDLNVYMTICRGMICYNKLAK